MVITLFRHSYQVTGLDNSNVTLSTEISLAGARGFGWEQPSPNHSLCRRASTEAKANCVSLCCRPPVIFVPSHGGSDGEQARVGYRERSSPEARAEHKACLQRAGSLALNMCTNSCVVGVSEAALRASPASGAATDDAHKQSEAGTPGQARALRCART
jgi:hypothetical protein